MMILSLMAFGGFGMSHFSIHEKTLEKRKRLFSHLFYGFFSEPIIFQKSIKVVLKKVSSYSQMC
jgi:hypothetical protein